MLKKADEVVKLKKAEFEQKAPALRNALLEAQRRLRDANFSILLIISGNEGAGKSETVNFLSEWLDPRGLLVNAFWSSTDEEDGRPYFWRFWRSLPPKGRIGVFFGSWYTRPIIDRVFKDIDKKDFLNDMTRIHRQEQLLAREGVVPLKIWLHLSKKSQKKRFRKLAEDPAMSWRVTPLDWKFFKKYGRFRKISEKALQHTNVPEAPWHVLNGCDKHHRHLTVARLLLQTIQKRLQRPAPPKPEPDRPLPRKGNRLRRLMYSQAIDRTSYEAQLEDYQGRLGRLCRKLQKQERSLILAFEGNDAAGKGGTIRRLTAAMDARNYRVIPVAAPTEEERQHPYLWRFWRQIPMPGRVTIFDRTWYGRVLVERIEGFCSEEAWRRAYYEINDFEKELVDFGVIVQKFWLAVTKEEQLRRFKERGEVSWKKYKITEEDWRNRKKWDNYEAAVCDMVGKTDTTGAPWTLVESNNKLFGRIKVLKTVVHRLERELG